jgi:hypothetical protein
MCFIIWILLIVFCKIDYYLTCCYALLEALNQNLNLKFHQMDFWFEFLDIHMNEKTIICHDCHGFKWQNINIYPILTIFICNPMPFLACCIVIVTYYIKWNDPNWMLLSKKLNLKLKGHKRMMLNPIQLNDCLK